MKEGAKMAKKKDKRVFETDRKMELRLRLALGRVGESDQDKPSRLQASAPEQELVTRLIQRVQSL